MSNPIRGGGGGGKERVGEGGGNKENIFKMLSAEIFTKHAKCYRLK